MCQWCMSNQIKVEKHFHKYNINYIYKYEQDYNKLDPLKKKLETAVVFN